MTRFYASLADFVCFWFCLIEFLVNCQKMPPHTTISPMASECNGVETFERVNGVDLPTTDRIPLFSSTNGAITADCYNRCRSSNGCAGFWIDYESSDCYRLPQSKFVDRIMDVDFTRASANFERLCLFGDICSKAWVAERIPGYELMGHDDVIIRSVVSRKRCIELCLTDKRLPCRSADFWESRKECRLSREDRRSQPGSFIKSSTLEVDYIENACIEPMPAERGKECEWEVMHGAEFKVFDFTTKASSMADCQRACETYHAFTCRSITFDAATGLCLLSGSDASTTTTSSKLLRLHQEKVYAQRVSCVDMSLECLGDSMVAKLKSHSPFYGKMFAIHSSSPDCEVFGHGKVLTTINYPLNSCGIHKDSEGSFIATLIVQQHPQIQKRGDSAFRLVCSFPEANRTLSKVFGYGSGDGPRFGDTSASPSASPGSVLGVGTSVVINSTAKSPTVTLRILDANGDDVTGVSLGDELFLKVEVGPNSAYGVVARELIAKSGTNDDELILLDARGCPEDPAIFPHLRMERADSKSLKSRFEAFKFTNDAVVRFEVHVQFCRHECSPVKCDGDISFGRKRRGLENGTQEDSDLFELRREIIVSSPSSNRLSAKFRVSNGTDTLSDDNFLEMHKGDESLCGSKSLVITIVIGFSIIQILIVFFAVICVCQKYKDKNIQHESNLAFSSPRLFQPSLINCPPRTLRANRRN